MHILEGFRIIGGRVCKVTVTYLQKQPLKCLTIFSHITVSERSDETHYNGYNFDKMAASHLNMTVTLDHN